VCAHRCALRTIHAYPTLSSQVRSAVVRLLAAWSVCTVDGVVYLLSRTRDRHSDLQQQRLLTIRVVPAGATLQAAGFRAGSDRARHESCTYLRSAGESTG
jgi:hypothetical protein